MVSLLDYPIQRPLSILEQLVDLENLDPRFLLSLPSVKEAVNGLVGGLSSIDEEERQEAVDAVRMGKMPWLSAVLVDRLVQRLRSTAPWTRHQAIASLADLGPPAVSALLDALTHSKSANLCIRYLEALAKVAPRLDRAERVALAQELTPVSTTKDRLVAAACARTFAALRLMEAAAVGSPPTATVSPSAGTSEEEPS